MFACVFRELAMPFADEERENAMMSIPVDGVPFGERPPEFRRPGSNFYATRYLEARAALGMLVELGIRDGVVDVIRGDSPDVSVQYADGRTVYVEHSMVLDEGAQQYSIDVEDANIAVGELVKGNPEALRAFERGMLTVRLNRIDLDKRLEPLPIAREIVFLLEGLTERVDLMRVDPARMPVLASMDALIFYRPDVRGGGPIDTPAYHARLKVLEPSFRTVLAKKIRKAAHYPVKCRPLWLLLTVDMHFDNPSYAERIAKRIVDEGDFGAFDRIVVQVSRLDSVVADSS
jgi:hypothetical protein